MKWSIFYQTLIGYQNILFQYIFILYVGLCLSGCKITKSTAKNNTLNDLVEKSIDRGLSFTPSSKHALLISVIQGQQIQTLKFPKDSISYNTILDNNSAFLIGGLSKVYVIALLKQLETNNLLNLNEKVNYLFPEGISNKKLSDLSFKDLINHHSGFPKIPNNIGSNSLSNPYMGYNKNDLLKFYAEFIPPLKVNFGYSHINYALIEIALEYKFKMNLNELIDFHIFNPMKLKSSYIFEHADSTTNLYPGYKKNELSSEFLPFSSFGASLGIVSTMKDLAKLTFNLLHHNNLNFNRPELTSSAHVKRIKMQGGWYKLLEENNTYLMHAGRSEGHYAFIVLNKSYRKAVIILSNSAKGVEFLGIDIIRSICKN